MLSSKVQEVYSFVFRIEELQNVIIAVKKQIYTCVCVYIYARKIWMYFWCKFILNLSMFGSLPLVLKFLLLLKCLKVALKVC